MTTTRWIYIVTIEHECNEWKMLGGSPYIYLGNTVCEWIPSNLWFNLHQTKYKSWRRRFPLERAKKTIKEEWEQRESQPRIRVQKMSWDGTSPMQKHSKWWTNAQVRAFQNSPISSALAPVQFLWIHDIHDNQYTFKLFWTVLSTEGMWKWTDTVFLFQELTV